MSQCDDRDSDGRLPIFCRDISSDENNRCRADGSVGRKLDKESERKSRLDDVPAVRRWLIVVMMGRLRGDGRLEIEVARGAQ